LFGTFRTGGGNPFDRWLRPGNVFLSGYGPSPSGTPLTCVAPACDINTLTVLEPVGPNSINPSRRILPVDGNNFGPAIGFAWRLPWLGEGKTTVRGGYQITFGGSFGSILNAAGGPVISTQNQIDSLPGTSSVANLNLANFNGQYLDLTSIPSLIPIAPTSPATPGRQLTVYPTTSPLDFHAWDSNYVTPYVQNFNLSVSRTLTRNVQLDVRYIGTMGRKQTGIVDLNTPNVYHNQELFDAPRAHASRRQCSIVRSDVRRTESEQQRLWIWSCGNHLQWHASNRLIAFAAERHIRSFSGERQLS
jgi:hypothetical protein